MQSVHTHANPIAQRFSSLTVHTVGEEPAFISAWCLRLIAHAHYSSARVRDSHRYCSGVSAAVFDSTCLLGAAAVFDSICLLGVASKLIVTGV